MIDYDPSVPLIFLHMPKAAGTSVKELMRAWYGDDLYLHYFNEENQTRPQKQNFFDSNEQDSSVAIYGHFNRARKFGVEHYYPSAKQFVTLLRDPFERIASVYFFFKNTRLTPLYDSLSEHILNATGSQLDYFPCEITFENYKNVIETLFVEIGVTKHLDRSLHRIAKKLNKEYSSHSLKKLNVSVRDEAMPTELKDEFRNKRQLEFEVYDYVLNKF